MAKIPSHFTQGFQHETTLMQSWVGNRQLGLVNNAVSVEQEIDVDRSRLIFLMTNAAQALLNEALKRGGRDNVTIIVAGYHVPRLEPGEHPRNPERSLLLDSTSDSEHPSLARS